MGSFLHYRALNSGFDLNIYCAAFSRLQHAFPTPHHAQPEFAVIFAGSSPSEPVALFNLLLKEIAFIKHDAPETKHPAKAGLLSAVNVVRGYLFRSKSKRPSHPRLRSRSGAAVGLLSSVALQPLIK